MPGQRTNPGTTSPLEQAHGSAAPAAATLSLVRTLHAGGLYPLAHTLGNVGALCAGCALVVQTGWSAYLAGQFMLTLTFVHAFVLLHEAGHQTLFRNRRVNRIIGHYAGFISVIPFESWRRIHARHHRYTGWQDLDATTAALVPREIKVWERWAVNVAWRTWLPLFSALYRLQNYWFVPRMRHFLNGSGAVRAIHINIIVMLAIGMTLVFFVSAGRLLMFVGPALFVTFAIEDILLLSQHTHIPQKLSGGSQVRKFSPLEQDRFSRSLRLPTLLSVALMRFDLHGLHHMYPRVPGYLLGQIPYQGKNDVSWLAWIRNAKQLSGVDFLFRNRNDTGSSV